MRIRMALALLALAAGLSACGGGSADGPGAGGTIATPRTTAETQGRGGRSGRGGRDARSCVAMGISAPPFGEGACVERGTRYVVANGRSVMRLRSLDAALRGFTVAEAIEGRDGPVTPVGAFLVVDLSVENTTDRPVRFMPGQTLMLLDDQRFQERQDVEERVHEDALAFAGRAPIEPGRTVKGSVVYDIPIAAIERVTARGTLIVANFEGNPPGRQPEFGQFRIYLE
jgi:Domain of unknown function (DUF4352)